MRLVVVGSLVVCSALGCGQTSDLPVDDAGTGIPTPDVGASTSPDTGTTESLDAGATESPDAGSVVSDDAASAGPDAAGACAIDVDPTGWEELPDACLPRCSDATHQVSYACTTIECFWSVLAQDATPSAPITMNGHAALLDCSSCVVQEMVHCFSVVGCATEAYLYGLCDPATDADRCRGELDSANACIQLNPYAFDTCYQAGALRCFP